MSILKFSVLLGKELLLRLIKLISKGELEGKCGRGLNCVSDLHILKDGGELV